MLSLSQFQSDWALNQPWALEFQHHWGTGARVVRGTKCGVHKPILFLYVDISFCTQLINFSPWSQ